jgi:ribosomal protein S18 acetylase RimI-like enzyme
VQRSARRRGIAQRLMASLDAAAREEGKTVLVLDTVTGGDAERLYERAGWQRVGSVPKYALMPDGEFCATTFFYKHLYPHPNPLPQTGEGANAPSPLYSGERVGVRG